MESKLAMKQNIIDHLEIKCDNNEQCRRRSCLQIHGLDFSSNEYEGVLEKVEQCYSGMGNDNTYCYFNSDSELNNLLNPEFKRN